MRGLKYEGWFKMVEAEVISNVTSTVVSVLFWIFLLVAIVGGAMFAVWYSKFNIKVRIRELTGNKTKIVVDDKARITKDAEGTIWWNLFKSKVNIPPAPADSIDISSKGKKVVEFYKTEDGHFVPINDNTTNVEDFLFEPLTTSQRSILVGQIRKAEARKKQGWKDVLVPIVALGALVLLVVSLMVFWGDLAKPVLEMGEQQAGMTAQMTSLVNRIDTVINNKQIIETNTAGVPIE